MYKIVNNTKNVNKPERLSFMKKFLLAVMALSVSVLAAEETLSDRVDGLQAQLDRVLARAGIHFNGEFRSQFLVSSLSDDNAVDPNAKKSESVEYTSVDFDIVARPNTALSARATFRLHQDWRNFFSDVQNPITTRWLSIDGTLLNGIVGYNLGDYRKKLTPLTIWAPEIDFLYEPEIFAINRRFAMSESFLGNNERALQGGNMTFSAELYPLLYRLEADVFGARLAIKGTGETAVTVPGANPIDANFDRYLIGANLATQIFDGLGLGVSNILIYDHLASYMGSEDDAKRNSNSTNIFAARLNAETRAFMGDELFNVGVKAELAMSSDKTYNPDLSENVVDGMAINAGLFAKVNLGGENDGVRLAADFIMNNKDFINDAAQSPTFIQHAIMNNENGLSGLGVMNPFDAMYRSVFKFTPSQYFARGTTPYIKTAYNNSINRSHNVPTYANNVFQAALPGGMATADRIGPVISLCGSFLESGVTVGARIAMLTGMEDDDYYYANVKPKYDEMIFGAGFDIAKFAPVVGPSLKIGGSYGMYNQTNGIGDYENNLINIGLEYQFHQRFALLAGYQMLNMATPANQFYDYLQEDQYVVKNDYTFTNFAAGLSYRVADGGVLTFKMTMLTGDRSSEGTMYAWDGLAETYDQRPVSESLKYTALQPELYLTVKF